MAKLYLWQLVLVGAAILLFWVNYLAFHTVSELLCVLIAGYACFYVARSRCQLPAFFMILSATLLCVALFDLVHLLSYKGMGVFSLDEANVATQFWILGRYLLVAGLLTAALFKDLSIRYSLTLMVALAITLPAIVVVFLGRFPDAYLVGVGLTSFKVVSEYLIIGLLLLTILLLNAQQGILPFKGHFLLLVAIGVMILSELMFTLYQDVYGAFNAIGHILKLVAYLLIFNLFITGEEKVLNDAAETEA